MSKMADIGIKKTWGIVVGLYYYATFVPAGLRCATLFFGIGRESTIMG